MHENGRVTSKEKESSPTLLQLFVKKNSKSEVDRVHVEQRLREVVHMLWNRMWSAVPKYCLSVVQLGELELANGNTIQIQVRLRGRGFGGASKVKRWR